MAKKLEDDAPLEDVKAWWADLAESLGVAEKSAREGADAELAGDFARARIHAVNLVDLCHLRMLREDSG